MAGRPGGGWLRVSSMAQDEQLQRAGILRRAEADGVEIVKWYTLHGDSAWKGEQDDEMLVALDDASQRRIRVLYFYHTNRLERRGIEETFRLKRQFDEREAKLVSVTQPYLDTPGITAEVMLAMDAAIAKQESDIKSDRQLLLTIPEIRKNSAWYGKIPWGFEAAGPKFSKRLEPTELGREYIPLIFERVIRRDSLAVICKWLDSLRIRFRTDRDTGLAVQAPWWPAMLMRLIRNPVYMGFCIFCEGTTSAWLHQCEALVDPRTFRLANEALTDRGAKRRGPRGNPKTRAMLKGAIRCSDPRCDATGAPDSPMYKNLELLTHRRDGPKAWFYRCAGRGTQRKGCGHNVRAELVDDTVNRIIAATWATPVMMPTLVKGYDPRTQLEAVTIELRQLPARGLPRTEEQAERERLWALEDELINAEEQEDDWVSTPTGEVWADLYADVPDCDRGAWLTRHGFTVEVTRECVTVVQRSADGSQVTWTEPLPSAGRQEETTRATASR